MRALASTTLAAFALALALSLAPGAARADTEVTVGHNRIEPAEIKIKKGDTVTFHNVDEMPGGHTIAADDGSWNSGPLAKDEKFEKKFDAAGTTKIHIEQHPKATAVVIVE